MLLADGGRNRRTNALWYLLAFLEASCKRDLTAPLYANSLLSTLMSFLGFIKKCILDQIFCTRVFGFLCSRLQRSTRADDSLVCSVHSGTSLFLV